MLRMAKRNRFFVIIFALWLAIEPFTVSVLQAEEKVPVLTPTIKQHDKSGVVPMEEVMPAVEYLEYLLELRGLTPEEAADPQKAKIACEAKAMSDWMQMLMNIYQMMGSSEADVYSFYTGAHTNIDLFLEAEAVIQANRGAIKLFEVFDDAAEATVGFFAFLGKESKLHSKGRTVLKAYANNLSKLSFAIARSRSFKFLEFLAVPTTNVVKGAKKLTETEQYFRWVKRVTGNSGSDKSQVLQNYKGVARTIGIGLTVFCLILDGAHLYTSSDREGGRMNSWDYVSTGVWVLLSALSLLCMAVPGGAVVAAAILVWIAITRIIAYIASHNQKWKEAYKNSYWFLYEKDPAFKSFYDNRAQLKPDEKCASLIVAEKNFAEVLKYQSPQDETEKLIHANSQGVYEALEKQGILMTYYSQTGFDMPDYDINRLQELWRKKADYMSWKPNEEESKAEKERGTFGDILHAVNPLTYVSNISDSISSKGYENEIKNSDIKLPYFNPDFVLLKKYKGYLMGKNLKGGIYDIAGVRIEQSPFNYIPLVGIDSAAWSEELIAESFLADSFIVGSKEMIFFAGQLKMSNSETEQAMKKYDEQFKGLQENFLPNLKKMRESLQFLFNSFRDNPDQDFKSQFRSLRSCFGWQWNNEWGNITPKTIVQKFKPDIEQKLQLLPLTTGQMAVETVVWAVFAKHVRDTSALMDDMLKTKKSLLEKFDTMFKNSAIKNFLKNGTFLDVKGSSEMFGMDWFSGMYPAYEEYRKATQLFEVEVEKYRNSAGTAGTSHDSGWLFWKTTIQDPDSLLNELNAELDELKQLAELCESLTLPDIKIPVKSTNLSIFPSEGFKLITNPTEALDPNVDNQPEPAPTAK
ncbi:MAG: hypothetical protein HQM10_08370 [Candidatus Riflebacteria bacterium]|nr:hypothetical protein [Candidatus Riflebacteria bacterium]